MALLAACGALLPLRPVRRRAAVALRLSWSTYAVLLAVGLARLPRHADDADGHAISLALRADEPAHLARAKRRLKVIGLLALSRFREEITMMRYGRADLPPSLRSLVAARRADGEDDAKTTTIAMVGPVTGQYASFGEQMKNGAELAVADINASRRRARQEARCSRSATTPAIRNRPWRSPTRWPATRWRWSPGIICSGSSIPASKVYAEKQSGADLARLHQSDAHRRTRRAEHLPRLRPRRSAGQRRRQLSRQAFRRQEHRHHPRQDGLRQRPGRRDQEGAERGRQEGGAVRGLYRRREGLFGAGLEAEAGGCRRALSSAATTPRPA